MRGRSLRIDRGVDKIFSMTFSPDSPLKIWGGAVPIVHLDNAEDVRKILQQVGFSPTAIVKCMKVLNEQGHYEISGPTASEEVFRTARLID